MEGNPMEKEQEEEEEEETRVQSSLDEKVM
jgi:hypothetical protein